MPGEGGEGAEEGKREAAHVGGKAGSGVLAGKREAACLSTIEGSNALVDEWKLSPLENTRDHVDEGGEVNLQQCVCVCDGGAGMGSSPGAASKFPLASMCIKSMGQ